ncbi:MAG: ribonuclease Z [Desulfobacterales bacterium]|nr:ribonuclease Z [Desulfobacterales bacterium]
MTNDAPTQVTILGSGTCVPSVKRSACALMITTGDAVIVMDCGPGTMRRLTETGTAVTEVTHVFFSHFHPDHTGELAAFIFANKYPDQARRQRPLTLIAGEGFAAFFESYKSVYGRWIELPPDRFTLVELGAAGSDASDFADFSVSARPVAHNPESLAYKITGADDKTIVYSGDTDFSENLVELSRGADLLICEAAFPAELKVPGHLTPPEAGLIAERAGVRSLILTHFYPECDQVDMLSQCRQNWSGPLALAEDLMRVNFHP